MHRRTEGTDSVLGGLLAVASAATFALNNASLRRGVLTGSVAQAMAITVPMGLPIFFLIALLSGSLGAVFAFSRHAVITLLIAGVVHFVWGRYCNYRATRAIGTNLTAPIQQANLIVALVLAIVVLGETLTPLKLLGIGLILFGPYLALNQQRRNAGSKAAAAEVKGEAKKEIPVFTPRYAEGIIFALLSATGYGVSPVLVRLGLEGKGLGASIAGGLIAYTAATAVMVLFLLWPANLRHALAVKPESAKWFTFSGFLVGISQMFLYMAMALAPVTVVSPINRLSIVFRLYFSKLINPEHEVFGGGVIFGTVVSLAGAALLSLHTEIAAAWLPDAWRPLLDWHWP